MAGKRWTEDDLRKLPAGMVDYSTIGQNISKIEGIVTEPAEKIPSGAEKVQALGRLRTGEMNKTEALFATEVLDLQMAAKEIVWWEFEPMSLRLGVNCFYMIDFMAMEADGRLLAYEVKGRWKDDALVKIRTAAEKFPWPFIAVRRIKGQWEYRHF